MAEQGFFAKMVDRADDLLMNNKFTQAYTNTPNPLSDRDAASVFNAVHDEGIAQRLATSVQEYGSAQNMAAIGISAGVGLSAAALVSNLFQIVGNNGVLAALALTVAVGGYAARGMYNALHGQVNALSDIQADPNEQKAQRVLDRVLEKPYHVYTQKALAAGPS